MIISIRIWISVIAKDSFKPVPNYLIFKKVYVVFKFMPKYFLATHTLANLSHTIDQLFLG